MQVNYDEMLSNYKKNIETNLRGFSGGPAPFETWVPYEGDDNKSIEALMELAKESGQEFIAITHGSVTHNYISDRAKQAQDYIIQVLKELNYTHLVNIVGLKKNVLTVDYEDLIGHKPFHTFLIKLETILNEMMNEKFDIQTLNLDDKNKRKCGTR